MCEQCHPSFSEPPRHRARLWEIDSQWHCTIVGTCLSLGELKSAATRLGVRMASAKPSAYEVHTGMIHLASRERLVGKALTKLLDRKHAAAINRAKSTDKAKVRDEIEKTSGYVGTGGLVSMSPTDHMGLSPSAFHIVEIRGGNWKLID